MSKYTNTNTQIQINKYKYTSTKTQVQRHKYKDTNTNTQMQIHKYKYTYCESFEKNSFPKSGGGGVNPIWKISKIHPKIGSASFPLPVMANNWSDVERGSEAKGDRPQVGSRQHNPSYSI